MAGIIDIGSNSVRLLLDKQKTTVTTRLSEDLSITGKLKEEAMSRTLETLCGFADMTKAKGQKIYAFGTEPLRAASNAADFISRVKAKAGFEIDVVSGSEEAELAYLGACGGRGGTVIDIGGASVEVISGNGRNIIFDQSLPVGMIRLTEKCGIGRAEKLTEAIYKALPGFGQLPGGGSAYGVGGTFTSLGAMSRGLAIYDPEIVHNTRLYIEDLESIAGKLCKLGGDIDGIMRAYPTISRLRAEIITAGALFALNLAKHMELEYITVSESDNLEGYAIKHHL